MDENTSGWPERSEEELAWDDEFRNNPSGGASETLRGLVRFATRLPKALVEVPMELVPDEARRHARAAARESFLALRSLLGAVGDGIEGMLADPGTNMNTATVQGPPGTWGTGRAATTMDTQPTSSGKVKRISVTEEEEEEGKVPSDLPGDMP